MDWKVLAALGIGVAVVAGSGGKSAPKGPSRGPSEPEGAESESDALELLLIGCKADAGMIVADSSVEPYGVQWTSAVAGYNAAADLYDAGEDDNFELAIAAMDAMLPGCDWAVLSEAFSSEELGFGPLFRVWEAADRFAYKVIADEPLDVYDPHKSGCAEGWEYLATSEWGSVCVKSPEATLNPVEPIEMGFQEVDPLEMDIDLNP